MASQQQVNDLLERGLQLFGLGQQSEALALWQEVLQLEPQNPRAHEYLRFVSGAAEMVSDKHSLPVVSTVETGFGNSAVVNTGANEQTSHLLGQSWADLLSSPSASFQVQQDSAAQQAFAELQTPALVEQKTEALVQSGMEQDRAGQDCAEPLKEKASSVDLSKTFSAGSLLTSPPVAVFQENTAIPGKNKAEDEMVSSSVPSASEPGTDPWEMGDSITQTVTVSADEEFLEPLSGEFDIEEHSNDPATNPSLEASDELQDHEQQKHAQRDALDTMMQGAREMFSLGDFSGTLELVERVLQQSPEHQEAQDLAKRCQSTLLQMYESKIGDFFKIPRVTIPPDDVIWLNLHHRSGFLLSQIDGTVSYDDILSLSGMSRFETCKILVELLEQGVVAG